MRISTVPGLCPHTSPRVENSGGIQRKPNEQALWDSRIYLGEAFFNEIINHPIPIDMNILKALKRCSLGLDLYLWVAYRTFSLRAPQRLTWRQLYRQLGTDP